MQLHLLLKLTLRQINIRSLQLLQEPMRRVKQRFLLRIQINLAGSLPPHHLNVVLHCERGLDLCLAHSEQHRRYHIIS